MKKLLCMFFLFAIGYACTKDQGTNPELAYGDRALFDSAKNTNYKFYKNKPDTFYSGNHGPHGIFKLRFNSIAYKMLTDSGRLPKNGKFPEGSFIVKDVYKNGALDIYAYMYKHNGGWLWGEVHTNGSFAYTAKDGPTVCSGCHSQTGHRDNTRVFQYY